MHRADASLVQKVNRDVEGERVGALLAIELVGGEGVKHSKILRFQNIILLIGKNSAPSLQGVEKFHFIVQMYGISGTIGFKTYLVG